MFDSFVRLLKYIGYIFTAKVNDKVKLMNKNKDVVGGRWDEVIENKKIDFKDFMIAVRGHMKEEQSKIKQVNALQVEIAKLNTLKNSATSAAKTLATRLKDEGRNIDEIRNDADYMQYQAAHERYASTLTIKQNRINDLEQEIVKHRAFLNKSTIEIQRRQDELAQIDSEKKTAVANASINKQKQEYADVLLGISNRSTDADLAELRAEQQDAQTDLEVSENIISMDVNHLEARLLAEANKTQSNNEFENLIGLTENKPTLIAPPE